MRRLVLYAAAVGVAIATALFAWGWSEVRMPIITLGIALVGGMWWATRRFPEVRRPHLLVAAPVIALAAVLAAIALPSTESGCECPARSRAATSFTCVCPAEHYVALRIAIGGAGAAAAGGLLALARRRRALRP